MKTFIVDSFTEVPFRSNPAAVCFVEAPLSAPAMEVEVIDDQVLVRASAVIVFEGRLRDDILPAAGPEP